MTGEASGPWHAFIGYSPITVAVTSLDGSSTKTYRVVVEHGEVDDPTGVALTPGDGSLTLSWGAGAGDAAPTLYWARWRKSGTTAWLNSATLSGWKTGYGDNAPSGTAADGQRVSGNSYVITGLDNGVEYEVELRGTRGGNTSYGVINWLQSQWITARGTPGQTATALTITPSSPSREYGGTDDLSYTVSGLASGDTATAVVTGALARAAGDDAGTYAISMGTLAIASAYTGKYTLPSSPAVTTYTITPKSITAVSGVTVTSRPADGSTTASFDTSAVTGTGVLSAELADFRAGGLAVSGTFPAATPGTHSVSVTYSLQDQGSFKAANYALSATTDTLTGELTDVPACGSALMLFADGAPAEGSPAITVTAGLSSPAGTGGLAVTLTTGGTATVTDDYTLSSTTVNIAAGATAGTSTITVVDDAVDDDDETIILNAEASASSLTAAPLTLSITDNDDTPASPRNAKVHITATDDSAAAGFDDLSVVSLALPEGVTINPEFRSDHHSYRLTVPDNMDRLTFSGRFNSEVIDLHRRAYSLLAVGDLAAFEEVLQMTYGSPVDLYVRMKTLSDETIIDTNTKDWISPRQIELPPDATTVIGIGIYKTRVGDWFSGFHPTDEDTLKRKVVYMLSVTRGDPADDDVELKGLTASTGDLGFAFGAYRNPLNVPRGVDSVTLTPITNHPDATVTVNGADPAKAVALESGDNVIQVVVTSKDGVATQTYTVTVRRAPEGVSGLAGVGWLAAGDTQDLFLSRVFSDSETDPLIVTARSSNETVAKVSLAVARAPNQCRLTVTGVSAGVATITVTGQEPDGDRAIYAFKVSVKKAKTPPAQTQQPTPNRAPTVSAAIADATIVNESGTKQVSLSGVFSDADNDALTITAASSDTTKATVSVATDGSSLTVTAQSRGAATITVTAADGNGGTVSDSFTVTVKAAPTVASGVSDVSGLEVDATQDVSLAGVFTDADGDALTITASSSDAAKATVTVASDYSKLTLAGVAVGTATITVTAQDSDGNTVSDTFETPVAKKYASLIAQMYEWRNDPQWSSFKAHTDRWDRALLAFGETVADTTLTRMTAAEAQGYADQGWERWVPVTAALREIEAGG